VIDQEAIHIRPMQIGDLEQVQAIDRLSFSMPWPPNSYRYELNENSAAILWVAEACEPDGDCKVIGMIVIWLILDEAHVATLAIHPDYRRAGIGKRLLMVGLDEALKRGASQAMLEVRAGNVGAQELYRQFGFEVVYRRPRYYRDNHEDALLMNLTDLAERIPFMRGEN
jgi:ribosomal-protein-alanine N-acetyltransferase